MNRRGIFKFHKQVADTIWAPRWIAGALYHAGKNQTDLARHLGVSPSYVSRLANGRLFVSTGLLAEIMDFCNLEIIELRVRKRHIEKIEVQNKPH